MPLLAFKQTYEVRNEFLVRYGSYELVCVCVYLGITKIEIDCFGMTNMQNPIRLRGETAADLQRKEGKARFGFKQNIQSI